MLNMRFLWNSVYRLGAVPRSLSSLPKIHLASHLIHTLHVPRYFQLRDCLSQMPRNARAWAEMNSGREKSFSSSLRAAFY